MFLRVFAPALGFAMFRRVIHIMSSLTGLVGVFTTAVFAQQPVAAPRAPGYHCEARWKPGGEGGWDDLTLDSQAHRLYVARTDRVQVVDTERGAVVREIPGLDGGHDVALAADLGCGFVTSGESDTVIVFNLTSLRPSGAPISVGKKPDAIVYEPLTRHVFVFNRESNDASVIDAASAKVIATIPLGGGPASAAADDKGTLFVNLEDKNEVLTIDAQKNTVVHHWPVSPGTGPTGLVFDPLKHRLFAGCHSGQLIVLDTQSGKHLAELPIGQGANACAFDPGAGCAFASCGDGTLTVVQEDVAKPGAFRVVETVKTQEGARTMALDPRNHAVYLAAASVQAAPASTPGEKSQHPGIVPGSFVILKFTR